MSPFVRELVDRALKTFVQFMLASTAFSGFMESLAAGQLVIDVDLWGATLLGALGAVLSIVTSALSKLVGDDSPNLIPSGSGTNPASDGG